jgi:hypothetical protein
LLLSQYATGGHNVGHETTNLDGTVANLAVDRACVSANGTVDWAQPISPGYGKARGLGAAVSANGTAVWVWAQPISPGYGEGARGCCASPS